MQGTDFLLFQVPNHRNEPYHLALSAIDLYLKERGYCCEATDLLFTHGELFPEEIHTDFWYKINRKDYSDQQRQENHALSKIIGNLIAAITKCTPPLIGFSILHTNYLTSLYIIRKIKEAHPKLKVVMGGCGIKFAKIKNNHYQIFDYLIEGPGELAIEYILEHRIKGEEFDKTKLNSFGELPSERRPFVSMEKFCKLPLYKEFFGNEIAVMLNKGCPYRCSFCSAHHFFSNTPKADIAKSIEALKKYSGTGQLVHIADAAINADTNWLKDWAKRIVEEKLDLLWFGWFRLSTTLNDSVFLKTLHQSGCIKFDFGLESASSNVLKHMNKFSDTKAIYSIFDKIRQLNIDSDKGVVTQLNIIIGYPTETEKDFLETMRFVSFNRDIIHRISFCSFLMPNNLPLYDQISEDGLLFEDSSNWCSRHSSPQARRERMLRFKEHMEKLKLDYSAHEFGEVEDSQQQNEFTMSDWNNRFTK